MPPVRVPPGRTVTGRPRSPNPNDRRQREYQTGVGGLPSLGFRGFNVPTGRTRFPSSGVTVGPASKTGYQQPSTEWSKKLSDMLAGLQPALQNQTPAADFGAMFGGGGGGGRGGRGGGGGAPGIDPNRVRQMAGELFNVDTGPYDMMRAAIANQRGQATAYNPNIAGLRGEYEARANTIAQQEAQSVRDRLQALAGFGQQLAGTQGQAMQTATRDLAAQGANVQPYLTAANQMGGERTQLLANQGQFLGQLGATGATANADTLRSLGLIGMGAEANLGVNRQQLMNQLSQQEAQVALQQAQAQQGQNQARQEFLLKYGLA